MSNLLFWFISQRSLSKHEMKVHTLIVLLGWLWWHIFWIFVGQYQICYSVLTFKDLCQNIKWRSIHWLNYLAGFDDTFFEYLLVDVKFVNLFQLSKISVKTLNESPYLDWTTWLAFLKHFLSVQYIIKQLVSVKFVILLQLLKISVRVSNEIPYFDWTTWLALSPHFLNDQYGIKQLVSVKFVILF